MHEFEEVKCSYCDTPNLAVNLDGCLICETFNGACSDCLARHKDTHTQGDIDGFKREMLDEPPLTIRERLNEEMKAQIRQNAEVICKALDDREALVKQYERQCRELAEELDRRTPAS